MKADDTYFLRFLQTDQQLIVPRYQRNYSWTITECRQLWKDIYNLAVKGKPEHFLGSIVFISESEHLPGAIDRILLIDGQQRIISIFLLLHVLGKVIEEKKLEFITKKKLYNYYIFNQNESGELRYKLILTKKDNEAFRNILDDVDVLEDRNGSNLRNAFDFFYSEISEAKNDFIEKIYNSIKKLTIVIIALKQGIDKPQMIFESLNSTGLDLTQTDLIRNFILMDLKIAEQERLYNSYWFPMEKNFQKDFAKFDRFFRDYLTLKT